MAEAPKNFKFLSRLRGIEIIAQGRGITVRDSLIERYGGRNWRKLKGVARIEADNGYIGDAEIHWYEAHSVGAVLWKVKRPLER